MADRLGGKEGIEHTANHALRDAAAVITDAQLNVIAWGQGAKRSGENAVQVPIRRFHRQLAAVGHCIAGIEHQVEQGAFQLIGVGFSCPRLVGELHLKGNAFIDAALQQFTHGADQFIDIDRFGVQGLPAGKR